MDENQREIVNGKMIGGKDYGRYFEGIEYDREFVEFYRNTSFFDKGDLELLELGLRD